MIEQCPHCQQDLKLSEAQIAKVEAALAKLPEGKFLKMGCPRCKTPIELQADGTSPAPAAPAEGEGTAPAAPRPKEAAPAPKPVNPPPEAPKTPDLDWLTSGEFKEKEVIEDVPMALILANEGQGRKSVVAAFTEAGYKTVLADSAEHAIERMRFVNFAAVTLHSRYEGDSLADSTFHAHMKKMPMAKRRHIFYALLGPEFNTLYDLEALAHSANLVANDNESRSFGLILKKSLQDYHDLFGPYIATLKKHSKI